MTNETFLVYEKDSELIITPYNDASFQNNLDNFNPNQDLGFV